VVEVRVGEEITLRAAYHDTEDLRLVRWGATLRRRTGGTDEGWHLKLPVEGAGHGVRDELGLPLDAGDVGELPEEISRLVRAFAREAPIVHLADVRTRRTPYVLLDGTGEQLAELVDDRVDVLEGEDVVRSFHEIEVEARGPEADELLDAVVEQLVAAGGTPGTEGKAAAAFGVRAAGAPDVVVPDWPGPKDPAGDAVRCVLAANVRKFLLEDVRVRRDLPDAVHQMRVAARTLRSALRTFRSLVDREWADLLRDELHWAADALGAARDAEVHLSRLEEHARSLPPQDGAHAVPALDAWLRERLAEAKAAAAAELDSDRHLRLLVDLVEAVREPRLTSKARDDAGDVFPPLVKKAARKLEKAVDQLTLGSPAEDWHQARIRAKRARYAAEAVAPVLGKAAEKWGEAFEEVTDLLGDQHDSVVAQEMIRELASHADIDGPTGYALGLLDAVEVEHERADREAFEAVWAKVRGTLADHPLD
jgi:CHAD domain-containing protein